MVSIAVLVLMSGSNPTKELDKIIGKTQKKLEKALAKAVLKAASTGPDSPAKQLEKRRKEFFREYPKPIQYNRTGQLDGRTNIIQVTQTQGQVEIGYPDNIGGYENLDASGNGWSDMEILSNLYNGGADGVTNFANKFQNPIARIAPRRSLVAGVSFDKEAFEKAVVKYMGNINIDI